MMSHFVCQMECRFVQSVLLGGRSEYLHMVEGPNCAGFNENELFAHVCRELLSVGLDCHDGVQSKRENNLEDSQERMKFQFS